MDAEITQSRDRDNSALDIENESKWSKILRRFFPTGFKYELKSISWIAFPVIMTNLFQFVIPLESLTICGHLGKLELDAVALANSMINAFGLSVGAGLCTACDTLFAQAYGSLNKKRTGMFLQRSMLIISLAPLILWSLHLNMEPVFILLGQAPEVARMAANYMKIFLPGLLFFFNYLILARYMQNQDRVYPPMIVGAIGNVFNILSQYLAIYVLGFGYEASAVCQAVTYALMWLTEVIYILITKLYEETWYGWTFEAFYDWGHFLKLAIPGVGHVALEAICWEVCIFLAGVIGETELASQSIISQTEVFTYMIPLGLGVALNIRVGQYLGGNNPQGAKTCLYVGFCIITVTSTILSIIFLTCAKVLPLIFTSEPDIIEMTSALFPYMVFIVFTDNIAGVCGGVLRGCGRQKMGALMIFIGYYVLGLPIAIILAFVAKMSITGLWVGISVGLVLSTFGYVIILKQQNWEDQAAFAQDRLAIRKISFDEDPSELSSLLPHRHMKKPSNVAGSPRVHVRVPSHPYSCSTDFPPMPPPRPTTSSRRTMQVLKPKIIALLLLLLLFSGAIALNSLLPRELYWPTPTNVTTIGPTLDTSSAGVTTLWPTLETSTTDVTTLWPTLETSTTDVTTLWPNYTSTTPNVTADDYYIK